MLKSELIVITCFCIGCYALLLAFGPFLVFFAYGSEVFGIVIFHLFCILAALSSLGILFNIRYALTPLSLLILVLFLIPAGFFADEMYYFYLPAISMSPFLSLGFLNGLERRAEIPHGSSELIAATALAAPLTYWLCVAYGDTPAPSVLVEWILGLSSLASLIVANCGLAAKAFRLSANWKPHS